MDKAKRDALISSLLDGTAKVVDVDTKSANDSFIIGEITPEKIERMEQVVIDALRKVIRIAAKHGLPRDLEGAVRLVGERVLIDQMMIMLGLTDDDVNKLMGKDKADG